MESPSKSDTKLRCTKGKSDRFYPIKMKIFFMIKLSLDNKLEYLFSRYSDQRLTSLLLTKILINQ